GGVPAGELAKQNTNATADQAAVALSMDSGDVVEWRRAADHGGRGEFGVFHVVEQRVAGLLPSVESSAQGADAGDAEAVELHGDLCRGLLRRAGAVEDDVAIAWDAVGEAGDLGRADAQGAGQHAR